MNNWNHYKLSDICKIKSGKRLPFGHELTSVPTNHPYIKARDIKGGKINISNLEYISERTHNLISKYIVNTNDVCITIVANIGDVGIVPKDLNNANLTENALRLTQFNINVDPKFLCYVLSSKTYKNYCELLSAGAAQAKLGIYKVKAIRLFLPPLPEQQLIASIISAYDDLIEVNNKRIALLEQMAEQIFKEWFVRMRFPGYEHAEFKKGVPKKWKIKNLNELLSLNYGKSLLEEKRDGGEVPVYGSSGIVGYHSKSLVKGPGIIVGRKGNVGSVFYCHTNFFAIDTVYYVETKLSLLYLFYLLKTLHFIAGDAAVPGLNREQAYSNKILFPGNDKIEKFHNMISPIFDQIRNHQEQVNLLKQTKDLLLPRLISGKLRVKEIIHHDKDLQLN